MSDKKEQYIGPFKVIGITEDVAKTPAGKGVVKVIYEDRPAEIMTKKGFDLLVKNEPVDLGTVQKEKFDILIPEIISVMAEYDIRMFELSALLTRVNETIESHFERAASFLWTGDDRNWIPGMNFLNNRTLIESDKILKSIGTKGVIEHIEDEPKGKD